MASLHLLPFTLDNTIGALLVGFAVSCVVYGILTTQSYVYFTRFPEDKWTYKVLVLVLLALETADQVFIGHIVYFYTIVNFANIPALLNANVTWSFIMQSTVGSVVGTLVKTAFAMRVWRFSKGNYLITGIILITAWAQLGLAILFSIRAFALHSVFDVVRLRLLGSVSLGVGVFTDLVTAGALSYYLLKLRTGYHQSDTLVRSLILYAVNTGFLTSAISGATVVLYNIMPSNLIFISVYFILSKMYAISFMATLNTRRAVRGKGTDRQGGTTSQHGNTRERAAQSTNLFHLGTRIPSQNMDGWDYAYTKETAGVQDYPPVPAMPKDLVDPYYMQGHHNA